MQGTPQPVRVTGRHQRLTRGVFTAGPFKGQRAITLDDGIFLPAGERAPSERTATDVFEEVWANVFGKKGGAA